MSNQEVVTVFIVASGTVGTVFLVGSCQNQQDVTNATKELNQTKLMIDAGYVKKQVPDRFTTEWVKESK